MSANNPETLVIITPGFAADEQDSTCLPAHQAFVKSLQKVFPALNLIVIALEYPLKKAEYGWFGVRVIPLSEKEKYKILRPLLWRRLYFELRKIRMKFPNTSLLSFWCLEGAFVGNLFAKRYNVKHRIWITGQDARQRNRYVSWIRPKPNDLIAMSDFLADEFEKNYGIRPPRVVPNGINPDSYPLLKSEKSIDLLAAGSLIPFKQYSVFIDVAAELIKINPSLKAVLCGAGPEEKMLRKKIAVLKLDHAISLTGEIGHDQVLGLMQQSKIFIHPSSYEGYSTVCLEALYAGCHVVSLVAPEKKEIKHWHIAKSAEEINVICKNLLSESDFTPVLVHHMDDCAREMMKLF